MSGRDIAQLAWALAKLRFHPPAAWMHTLVVRVTALASAKQLLPQVRGAGVRGVLVSGDPLCVWL